MIRFPYSTVSCHIVTISCNFIVIGHSYRLYEVVSGLNYRWIMSKCVVCGAFAYTTKEGAECPLCYSDQFTTYDNEFKTQSVWLQGVNLKTHTEALRSLQALRDNA